MKRRKYGNIKKVCFSNHLHDSMFECAYCNKLMAAKQNGQIKDFEIQRKYDLVVNKVKICKHIVDFIIIFPSGYYEVHEVKGMKTAVWKLKYKLFKALYPDIPYNIIEKGGTRARRKRR